MCKKLAVVLEILLGCGVVLGWEKERGGGGGEMDGGEEGFEEKRDSVSLLSADAISLFQGNCDWAFWLISQEVVF